MATFLNRKFILDQAVRIQIAQSRVYVHILGPKVGLVYKAGSALLGLRPSGSALLLWGRGWPPKAGT